jgi:predicted HTH transcriptional regulator
VIEDDEVMISIKPVRSAVAVYLHDMGYIFFGVSKEALDRIGLRIYGYVKRQVEAWFRG